MFVYISMIIVLARTSKSRKENKKYRREIFLSFLRNKSDNKHMHYVIWLVYKERRDISKEEIFQKV